MYGSISVLLSICLLFHSLHCLILKFNTVNTPTLFLLSKIVLAIPDPILPYEFFRINGYFIQKACLGSETTWTLAGEFLTF